MRPSAGHLLLFSLLACQGGKPDNPKPKPQSDEQCFNGLDDDGDGLVDCEDGECFGDNQCGETDCSDEADGDGDGLVDCVDSECWGTPDCDGEVLGVVFGGQAELYHFSTHDPYFVKADGVVARREHGVIAQDVTGSVVRLGLSSSQRCTFAFDKVVGSYEKVGIDLDDDPNHTIDSWTSSGKVTRNGPGFNGDCGLDQDVLPSMLLVRGDYHDRQVSAVPRDARGNLGPRWYGGRLNDYKADYSYYWWSTTMWIDIEPNPPVTLPWKGDR